MDFAKIVGHENIITHLKTAILEDKVGHAYILNGADGTGKMMLAESYAKAILCQDKSRDIMAKDSCNCCQSCLQAETKNHPDIMYITHEKASIGVDDIRTQVNSDIVIKPYSSEKKIYIIDEAEKMTEGAQNALLKTIEEPPEYAVIFLLVNNSSALLPTILSRCVQLNLRPVARGQIKQLLMEQYHTPDYLADVSANFSQGNVGKAIRYATSEDFAGMKSRILDLVGHIWDMKVYELMDIIKQFAEDKANIIDALDLLLLWFRDVLIYKATGTTDELMFLEDSTQISNRAEVIEYDQIEAVMQAIETAKTRLKANVNFDITIEMMLLAIKGE